MKRLLVISHTPHYLDNGQIVGWGPTVRELDYLATAFGSLTHLAPLYSEPAPASAIPYASSQVTLHPVRPTGGQGWRQKADVLWEMPAYIRAIQQALREADLVQVRCPCNIGLVACLILGLKRQTPRWAKYAGNWQPDGSQPWSYTFQRLWLAKGLMGGPVTINGHWPNQPGHVYSFLNPCLTGAELSQAAAATTAKRLNRPVRLLFVGRLEAAKGAGRALEIGARLRARGYSIQLDMIGDGPERPHFEAQTRTLGLSGQVYFHGWLPRAALDTFYRQAHFLLLPSAASEGWPKVLSEGMAYKVVPVAGAVSSIPQILSDSGAGLAVSPLDVGAYVEAVEHLLHHPARWEDMAGRGQTFARAFSYEAYVQHIAKMLEVPLPNNLFSSVAVGESIDSN